MNAPDYRAIQGCWNAYVAAGATKEERAVRLAECPEEFRAGVESHVRTVFAIRSRRALVTAEGRGRTDA